MVQKAGRSDSSTSLLSYKCADKLRPPVRAAQAEFDLQPVACNLIRMGKLLKPAMAAGDH